VPAPGLIWLQPNAGFIGNDEIARGFIHAFMHLRKLAGWVTLFSQIEDTIDEP